MSKPCDATPTGLIQMGPADWPAVLGRGGDTGTTTRGDWPDQAPSGSGEQCNAGRELWTATGVLMGLRYDEIMIQRVLRGVREMKESTFYQAVVREGKVEALHETLLHLGE